MDDVLGRRDYSRHHGKLWLHGGALNDFFDRIYYLPQLKNQTRCRLRFMAVPGSTAPAPESRRQNYHRAEMESGAGNDDPAR